MQASGNHGRNNTDPPPLEASQLVPSTTPQQSTRGFVAPSSVPVKRTPDITDIIGESRKQKAESNDEMIRQLDNEMIKGEGTESESEKIETDLSSNHLIPSSSNHLIPDFPAAWHTAFNNIFSSIPTIYIPLKETLPQLENNIITVNVKNDIQKEHFEAKAREMLAYLRTQFDEKIEDIVVKTNELLETKKIIYDVKDKLQNFKEQNVEFDDFIQILDLKIKE
jgi:hypothetical protein